MSIPTRLYERIRELIEGTGFSSVSEYVTYVLRELLAIKAIRGSRSPELSEEELEELRRRLEALGYL